MAVDDVGGERAQRSATPRVVQVRSTNIVQKYAGRQSIVLGVVLAVAATLSCIFNIVDLAVGLTPAVRFTWGAVGHGFWTGIACAVAGGFGIVAGLRKTKYQIATFNVLCIVAASLTFGQFVVGIIGAAMVGVTCPTKYTQSTAINCQMKDTLIAMEVLLASLALVEAVAALWGCAICCMAYCCCCTCCCDTEAQSQTVTYSELPLDIRLSNQQVSTSVCPADSSSWFVPTQAIPAPGRPAYGYSVQPLNPADIQLSTTSTTAPVSMNLYDVLTAEYAAKY